MKFADRAKNVFSRIQPNEILAADQGLIKKLTEEINNLKQILSLRKRRGNYGDIENQFVKLKEENERLKMTSNKNEDVEKLIYENKLLKVELQKMRSKTDFYEDINLLQNIDETSKTNENYFYNDNIQKINVESLREINSISEKYNQEITNKYYNKVNSIREEIDNFTKLQNLDRNSIDLKSPISGSSNLDFVIKNNEGNIDDVIKNLIKNNNESALIYNKTKSKDNFHKDSMKKESLSNSLFKAGESVVSSQLSVKTADNVSLKKVNERLRYLEKLEKESNLNLNKQKEKIKNKNLKKEEEMKKKIEDV